MGNNENEWKYRVLRSIRDYQAQMALGEDMVSKTGEKESQYIRKFKTYAGEPPYAFQKRLRMERGIHLLRKTGLRICDIAAECGYESQEAFSKAFKKSFGLTPKDLRRLPTWSGGLFSPIHAHYTEDNEEPDFLLLKGKGGFTMNMKTMTLDRYRVVALKSGGDYWGMPKTWQRFHEILSQSEMRSKALSYLSVFYDHHKDIPMAQKQWDTGILVKEIVPLPEGLDTYLLPGGLYAIYVHFGPCEEIGPAWEAWTKAWLPESPYRIDFTRPSLEWYQSAPPFLPPELHLTFLCDPIEKKDA
ncbi:MAG TPA: AraC family transcriptional regulator [Thermotogota bacterium]|nr:AraC family transcriptional regulator [Thermotogota bacterium]